MKIAVLILAHKNPLQLKRLVNILNNPDIDIFIHIDKKSDVREDIKDSVSGNANTHIIDEQVSCYLYTMTLVEATILLMQAAKNKIFDLLDTYIKG